MGDDEERANRAKGQTHRRSSSSSRIPRQSQGIKSSYPCPSLGASLGAKPLSRYSQIRSSNT